MKKQKKEIIKKTKVELPVKKDGKVKKVLIFVKDQVCRFWRFATSKPNNKENIVQYFLRQLILTDASGNPSWTVTILFFVMVLNAITLYIEYKLALSAVITYSPEGKMLSWQLKGLSTEFYYLLLSLSVVITGLFRARQKQQSKEVGGIIETASSAISSVKDAITKIKVK